MGIEGEFYSQYKDDRLLPTIIADRSFQDGNEIVTITDYRNAPEGATRTYKLNEATGGFESYSLERLADAA